jgi:hypothetical protein
VITRLGNKPRVYLWTRTHALWPNVLRPNIMLRLCVQAKSQHELLFYWFHVSSAWSLWTRSINALLSDGEMLDCFPSNGEYFSGGKFWWNLLHCWDLFSTNIKDNFISIQKCMCIIILIISSRADERNFLNKCKKNSLINAVQKKKMCWKCLNAWNFYYSAIKMASGMPKN